MKVLRVNAYQKALIFKRGVYKGLLGQGTYWLWGNEEAIMYEVKDAFHPFIPLNVLLQDADLANALQVVAVKEGEIVLRYEDGLLKQVLTAGRYAYWKEAPIQYEFIHADITQISIDAVFSRSTLTHTLLVPYVRTYTVESYEQAILFVDGKYVQTLSSGIYMWWKNSTAIHIGKVDTRQLQMEINGQEILTKDKAALRINAWLQYKVTDIEKALLYNKEYDKQLYTTIQLALRQYVASYSFDELLEKKEDIAPYVQEAVAAAADVLGVQVLSFGIRDIVLPGDVKDIMNQVLVAEKKAQANTIMRREETASTRSLLNTAKLMEENTMLWKLKEMEYVEKIADKISNISVNGNGALVEQLKGIFGTQK